MSRERTTEAINELFGTKQSPPGIRVFRNWAVPGKTKIQGRIIRLNAAQVSTPEEAQQAIPEAGLRDIWYGPEVQKAWQYVRSNLRPTELTAELNRRKALGLRTDPAIVQEGAAIARVTNLDGRDRIVENFHNAIRREIGIRFGLNLPRTAKPQLKEAVIRFLGDRDGLRGVPISNHALIPKAAVTLGKWGETRLRQVLNETGKKPSKPSKTSLSYRFPDRVFNRIAHESKGGLNVKLTSKIRTQILKDADLIRITKFKAVHWHFFQGAQPDVLKFLEENGIGYTIY
jgi:hypothetical protein